MEQGKLVSPLVFLVSTYHDENVDIKTRIGAATAALPFIHRKVEQTAVLKGGDEANSGLKVVINTFAEQSTMYNIIDATATEVASEVIKSSDAEDDEANRRAQSDDEETPDDLDLPEGEFD